VDNLFKISVIVATYNWPEALRLCLLSLITQTDKNYEIIVADDGSQPPTKAVIDEISISSQIPLQHLWQEDDGCRKTKILNSDFNHDYNLVIITFAFNMIIIYVMTDLSWL
jgi:glycosyltransferase involved in cell wall biosynthesis